MCKVRYLHKLSVAAHGGEGYDLEVEVCSDPAHGKEFIESLGKIALEASRTIRRMT